MITPSRPSIVSSLVGILLTSAFFGAWLNNPFAGLFMLCFLSCVHLGVFRGTE